uniref:ANK_REP_REGION domain-containing protein n=1 Tax=Macrostomum lignano TaxID=282301 RepID=A0A1I8HDH9_9PLAT
PPTPLEAALSAGAADAELERLLDRRDEFGDDALTEEVERADTEADAAVLSLLTRPRLAERCWQPALFSAARCGRSGLLQRLRDADPAAWRRAVRSAGPDGRRVLHHAAAGGRVEAMLRLLRMLRMHHHQQQQPEAAMGDAGAEEEAPDEAEEAADEADEKRRAEKNLEQEAEALDTEEDFAELVYAVDCRGRTFLSELADLHPQALSELWPAELPGGLARVLELLDPPLQGLTDLPDRQAALETVAIAQEPVKRITASGRTPRGQLVRLSQSASSLSKLLPALLRLGLVRPADCEQSFVLELVKAGWLAAASQLMRLQQTRLVETCVA